MEAFGRNGGRAAGRDGRQWSWLQVLGRRHPVRPSTVALGTRAHDRNGGASHRSRVAPNVDRAPTGREPRAGLALRRAQAGLAAKLARLAALGAPRLARFAALLCLRRGGRAFLPPAVPSEARAPASHGGFRLAGAAGLSAGAAP